MFWITLRQNWSATLYRQNICQKSQYWGYTMANACSSSWSRSAPSGRLLPQIPVAWLPSPASGGRPTCSSPSLPNTMASWGDYQQVIIGASPAGVLTSQNLLEAVLALQPKSGWVTENFSNRLGPFGPPPKPKGGRKASAISVKTFRSMSLRCSAT